MAGGLSGRHYGSRGGGEHERPMAFSGARVRRLLSIRAARCAGHPAAALCVPPRLRELCVMLFSARSGYLRIETDPDCQRGYQTDVGTR